MKLTVFSGGFAPVGGVESFLFDLLSAVSARGIECELFCWNGVRNPLLGELVARGVGVHRSPWRWGCRWAWPDKLLLATAGRAILAPDLVLFGKPLPAAIHRRLVAWRGARPSPRFVLVTPYRPAEMWRTEDRPLLTAFDAIAVQAGSFLVDLRRLGYEGPVAVLPYIPPPCTRAAPLPFGPLRIGFLGRLVTQKNLPYLLEAFRSLSVRRPAILNLYGDGPLRSQLSDLALRLGIQSSVRFCSWLAPADVPAAIDSCSLFAFTSTTEGQCLAALEILARGRPIVATPVGAFPEMLDDPRLGRIASPDSPDDFADSLLALADCRPGPAEVQEVYARRFDRDKIIDGYLSLLCSSCPSRSFSWS